MKNKPPGLNPKKAMRGVRIYQFLAVVFVFVGPACAIYLFVQADYTNVLLLIIATIFVFRLFDVVIVDEVTIKRVITKESWKCSHCQHQWQITKRKTK